MQLKRNKDLKFDILKKSHKKEIIIGALTVCAIGAALTFATSKAKYKLTQDIPLVRGTVNYKVPDLRVVALYTANDNGDYVEANNVPTSGYQLNTEKSMCKVYDGTTSIADAPKDNNVTIEYKNGKIYIGELSKKNTRCYLYFDKYVPKITNSDIIAAINPKSTTPDFGQSAITDEGVFQTSDGMYGGTSYYWRGATTNNYVKFANFCWRIIRINGDGSLRLIYDGTTCHANGISTEESIAAASVKYNITGQSNYVGWTYNGTSQRTIVGTSSNAKTELESWYATNVTGTNAQKVAQGKYCNDRNVESGYTWAINGNQFHYAAYKRISTDHSPSLACPSGDVYTLSVGLITADEVMYAGAIRGSNSTYSNNSYYLYNGKPYWTMTPYYYGDSNPRPYVFVVSSDGYIDGGYVYSTVYGLRPVINLRSDVTFKSGTDGTINNPYEVV